MPIKSPFDFNNKEDNDDIEVTIVGIRGNSKEENCDHCDDDEEDDDEDEEYQEIEAKMEQIMDIFIATRIKMTQKGQTKDFLPCELTAFLGGMGAGMQIEHNLTINVHKLGRIGKRLLSKYLD